MNLTSYSIKNNRVIFGVIIIFIFIGISVFNSMPRNDYPPFTLRFATIVINYPGATPESLENIVTDQIEKSMQEYPEVKKITSTTTNGLSVIQVELKDYVNASLLTPTMDKLRREIDDQRALLPQGCYIRFDGGELDVYGIIIGIAADPEFEYKELKDMADDLRNDLVRIPEAGKVEIDGEQEQTVYVEFDDAKMSSLGLTTTAIQNVLRATNIIFPGGNVVWDRNRLLVEPTGNFESVEDIMNTIIKTGSKGEIVYLKDVAIVNQSYQSPPEAVVTVNGKKGMVVGVSLKEGANIVLLGEEVQEVVDKYNARFPVGIDLISVADQDKVVASSVSDFTSNLLQSIVIVLVVILIMLGLRIGLIVSSLIPMAMLMCLILMSFIGIGLDQISLAALILALGLMVDAGIVISESIMVKMEKGASVYDATIATTDELKKPLLISSLATSTTFLSFFLAESIMGEIFGSLFEVILFTLLSSWILALTFIPLLCVMYIKVNGKKKKESHKGLEKFQNTYAKSLIFFLKRPVYLLLALVFLFALSVKLIGNLPSLLFPNSERPLVVADFSLPENTRIEYTQSVMDNIDQYVKDSLSIQSSSKESEDGVVNTSIWVGKGALKYDLAYTPIERASNSAHMLINTTSYDANLMVIKKLSDYVENNFPEVDADLKMLGFGAPPDHPLEVVVMGDDPEVLFRYADSLKAILRKYPAATNIGDDWGLKSLKLSVNIDQARARYAGVTSQDIAVSLRTNITGSNVDVYREGTESIPIVLRSIDYNNIDVQNLSDINVFSQQTGNSVPLIQVADVVPEWQYGKIMRRDLQRAVTVYCNLNEGYTIDQITTDFFPMLENYSTKWRDDYSYFLAGDAEQGDEAMGSVMDKIPISIGLIILLLLIQFNSTRKTLIAILIIPLGVIGIGLGLSIANSYFGFMSFLALIALAGIAMQNGIVLMDRIQTEIDINHSKPNDAIIISAKERLRPILLTTLTTIAGMFPLWFGGGLLFQPMAIGLIFGLVFATLTTLYFVPIMFKLFYRIPFKDYKP